LITRALKIWRSCQTSYENIRDVENTYSLDDDINFTGEKIKYFTIMGQKIIVNYWVSFLQQLCIILYDLEPAKFRILLLDNEINRRKAILSNNKNELRLPMKISDNLFIEGNLSTEYILYITKILLEKIGIDIEEVNVCLRENKLE
jgi:hypothetical protein